MADTIRPRLDALDADVTRVLSVRGRHLPGDETPVVPDLSRDLPALEALAIDRGAVLMVIDPVSAYLGGKTDSFKDADVRRILTPLAALAERTRVAVVAVMHLTKDAQRKVMYRGQGSLGFVAAARAVFALAPDPDDGTRRLLLAIKMNVAALPPGLAFHLTADAGSAARLEWDAAPVNVDAETALAGPAGAEERSERAEAKDFLADLLADGPVLAEEVKRKAKAAGIAERTLRRAAESSGVKKEKRGMNGPWQWRLPAEGGHGLPKVATWPEGGQVAIFEGGGHLRPADAPTPALVEVEL